MSGVYGMGWERDLPDFRDLAMDSPEILEITTKFKKFGQTAPASVNLTAWCSPIEDQGELGSCTANAGVGLMEYYQRRVYGKHVNGSRIFLYKVTRNLLGWTGDQGAYLRSTMKAMALFGIPPESYWPYAIDRFDVEPSAFCYAFAQGYQAMKYYRLDPTGQNTTKTLANMKATLAMGQPAMFGFTVYSSIPGSGDGKGEIPFPKKGERVLGGHAIVAVGYDDNKMIGKDVGALLIRNSWGTRWGNNGYGWLPYSYVTAGLAVDMWTLVESEFIKTDVFD